MGLGALFGGAGSFLGAASVELVADTKPLIAGLEKGKAETASASSSMGKATQGFSAIALSAYAIAGAALVKFTVDAVQAAERHQVAVTQLSVAAQGNTQAFLELASAQVKLTGFTEDSIIAAETQLARLHLTSEQMAVLLPQVEDYARATGKDLPAAAAVIEKATLGNARGMRELGMQYKATGNFATDLANVEKILASQTAGASAAYLKTAAGQAAQLNAQYDKLKIEIGQQLTPVWKEFLQLVLDLLPVIKGLGYGIIVTIGAVQIFIASLEDAKASAVNWIHSMEDVIHVHHGADEAMGHTSKAVGDVRTAIDAYSRNTDLAAAATSGLTGSQVQAGNSAAYLKKQQDAATAAAKAQKAAEDSLKGGLLGLVASQRQVAAAQATVNDLRKKGQTNTVAYGDAELTLLQNKLQLTDAETAYIKSLKGSQDTQAHVVAEILAMGKAFNLSKDMIDQLLGHYARAYGYINTHPLYTASGGFSLGGKTAANAAQGGSSANVTNNTVHVHVSGNVTTQNDLVRAVRTGLLQTQSRNSGGTGIG